MLGDFCFDSPTHNAKLTLRGRINISWLISPSPDLLTIEPHTPTPEPLKYDRKDGQWYMHDGVDIGDTQGRKGKYEAMLN